MLIKIFHYRSHLKKKVIKKLKKLPKAIKKNLLLELEVAKKNCC